MEIVKKFFHNLKTPVLAGVFSILFLAPCHGFEMWQERAHPAVESVSIAAGGRTLFTDIKGIDYITDTQNTLFLYQISLFASKELPLISKLSWQSTFNLDYNPYEITYNDKKQYSSLFAELRMPFTTTFLSNDTSWYLQYRRTASVYKAKAEFDMVYGIDFFPADSEISFGRTKSYIAVAIDTPIAYEDTDYSYSRAGLYYSNEERARSADVKDNDINQLLKVREHEIGAFFDISKPVFTEGFIAHISAQLGYSYRYVRPNPGGYKSSYFKDSETILRAEFALDASYRFKLSQNTGLRVFAGGTYISSVVLKTGDKDPSFNNDDEYMLSGGLAFDIIL